MTDPLDREPDSTASNGTDSTGTDSTGTDSKNTDGKKQRPSITSNRIILWVIVGGIGLYTLATGIVGLLTKSR